MIPHYQYSVTLIPDPHTLEVNPLCQEERKKGGQHLEEERVPRGIYSLEANSTSRHPRQLAIVRCCIIEDGAGLLH